MSRYQQVLRDEDPRIAAVFDVQRDQAHSGYEVVDDPFPALARLLNEAPVHKGSLAELMGYDSSAGFHFYIPGRTTYTTLSFEATSQALLKNELFSSKVYEELGVESAQFNNTILQKVGLDHRRLRTPLQQYFTPQMAATWWNDLVIKETVDILVSKIEGKGSADLNLELCARMPVHVISVAFGIDPEDIVPFRVALNDGGNKDEAVRAAAHETSHAILRTVVQARREEPREDLVSKLIAAEIQLDGGGSRPFTDEEIINHIRLILAAGGATTWRQLGITLYALLNHPDQMEAAKADRSLIPDMILESVRWHPTDLVFPRRAEQDVTLCGVDIPAGSMVQLCLGAANRDPSRWENPDKFDMFRPVQRSLGFAGGPHSCLGQHVSRQEMLVAINAVFDRLPNLRWDKSKPECQMVGSLFARGPSSLHVLFD